MDLFQWDRALDLAVRHKTHVDTVLGFRQIYLEKSHRRESSKLFKQYGDGVRFLLRFYLICPFLVEFFISIEKAEIITYL